MAGDSDDIIVMMLLNFFQNFFLFSDSSLCFVLVQMAYTEMFFVDKFWPEISHRDPATREVGPDAKRSRNHVFVIR